MGAVIVDPVQTYTYYLKATANPITFGPATNINIITDIYKPYYAAVFGDSTAYWRVTNQGSLIAKVTRGAGVWLYYISSGGTVDNQASGHIEGSQYGVFIGGGAGAVTNAGTIIGDGTSGNGVQLYAGGTVTNELNGIISSPDGGVYIKGGEGTVTNAGSITGVWLQTHGTVNNEIGGTLSSASNANAGYGVGLHAGGSVTNAGKITGPDSGVELDAGGTVTNQASGTIAGGYAGVIIDLPGNGTGTGNVNNLASGAVKATIKGDTGVIAFAGPGFVTNAGSITGTTLKMVTKSVEGSGTTSTITLALGDGVALKSGGSVTNQSGGTITGARYGVYITGGSGTVTDAGSIIGTKGAIEFLNAGASSLDVQSGGSLTGQVIVSGGALTVADDTPTNAPFVISGGGTLELKNGADANGTITFDNTSGKSETLKIDGATMPAAVISGFTVGDTIDLASVPLDKAGYTLFDTTLNIVDEPQNVL